MTDPATHSPDPERRDAVTGDERVLAFETHGRGLRLVCVHGFTQTRRCWGPIVDDLARDHEVVLIDAPGHGGSSAVRADLAHGARLMASTGGSAIYVGYSMGGRYALQLALDEPAAAQGLVLVSASPGIESQVERDERRRADRALADHLEQIGVAAFVDEWLAKPLFASLPPSVRCVRERLTNTVDGLASSLRLAGTGEQASLWDRLPELAMPVLIVTGALDPKFCALGERMAAAIGANATYVCVPGAGHTAHLEAPDAFLTSLRHWLATSTAAP